MLFNDAVGLCDLFLVNKQAKICHAFINALSLGQNREEALRMLGALQFYEELDEVCPANRRLDEDAMKPTSGGVASGWSSTRSSSAEMLAADAARGDRAGERHDARRGNQDGTAV